MTRALQLLCLLFLLSVFAYTQAPEPATITLTFDFPGSEPEHFSMRIQTDGKASYESRSKLSPDSEDTDSFNCEFTVSPATLQKIFDLAAKADYFRKDLDSHRKKMAFTGKKTLAYKDGQRSGESTYNYSANPSVQELTNLLQSVSGTLEIGHRLEYDRRYQKLALDQDLKGLEEQARSSFVIELQAIAPVLQQIIGDASVINVSRGRAQRILERAGVR